ncbi:hypothetical protein [Microbacterium sp. Root553]|uniref:hypothetical protein n=1 Tax=Microbacterium sp. Root553 TaxID=1736556 RepID=UPI0006F3FDF9|nr:hypothetical protein [Microbacterium sp. Root553]
MDRMITEIDAALRRELFTVALQATLALVDICGALESRTGRASGDAFKAWFSEHIAPKYEEFSAADAYELRCGMLHQGRSASKQYKAILFMLPGQRTLMHQCIADDAYILDLETFCADVVLAVQRWWKENEASEPVRSNAESLVRIRENGFLPYLAGPAVLA